jgi:tRNA(fMet)-specific endonuclease VapC
MSYLLDSDILSFLIRGHRQVESKYIEVGSHNVYISVISEAEILFGLEKNAMSAARQARVLAMLEEMSSLPISSEVAIAYSKVRAYLELNGIPIGPNDTWIASHALSLGATLVTNNVREFKRVKGLKVENWL